MKLTLLAVLGAGVLLVAGANGQGKGKTDEDKIQGTWQPVHFEREGKKGPEEELKETKLTIAKGKIKVEKDSKDMELSYKLDPSKNPKEIDITETKGGQDHVHKGIYALDGDTLKICWTGDMGVRPSEFKTAPGTDHRMLVLKRDKK
jgi:uncharacterized protein (TIGR03067 family)